MATRKKTPQKSTKRTAKKKTTLKKSSAAKASLSKKKVVKKKTAKPAGKKKVSSKKPASAKRVTRRSSPGEDKGVIERRRVQARPGGQSGDLQGLSHREMANSESVDELLEEGNAFEAGIVKGIEDAPIPEQGEIRTREVLEDDVPDEYLDEDHERG